MTDSYLGITYDADDLSNLLDLKVSKDLIKRQNKQYEEIIDKLEKDIAKEDEDSPRRHEMEQKLKYLTTKKLKSYNREKIRKRRKNNKLLGLFFKPNPTPNPKNYLNVQAVFFDARFVFKNSPLDNASFSSLSFRFNEDLFSLPKIGKNTNDLKFQFWNSQKEIRLAFFGKGELKLILSGANYINISGASINYGHSTFHNTVEKTYPTLKIETGNERNNLDDEVPGLATGIPCPTAWGSNIIAGKAIKYLNLKDNSFLHDEIVGSLISEIETLINSL